MPDRSRPLCLEFRNGGQYSTKSDNSEKLPITHWLWYAKQITPLKATSNKGVDQFWVSTGMFKEGSSDHEYGIQGTFRNQENEPLGDFLYVDLIISPNRIPRALKNTWGADGDQPMRNHKQQG